MAFPLVGLSPRAFLQKIDSFAEQIKSATGLPFDLVHVARQCLGETRPLVETVQTIFKDLEKCDALPKQIPFPDHFKEKINAECPFWPGKKVSETHVLKLLTQEMNTPDLNQFSSFWSPAQEILAPLEKTGWILMTHECVPATIGKTHSEALKILAETNYEAPPANVAIQILSMQNKEDPIFTKSATLVKETIGSLRCPVTLSFKGGLTLDRFSKPNPFTGMAAVQWL